MMRSVVRAMGFSLLLASYVLAVETAFLAHDNAHFLTELGWSSLLVLGWYAGFAVLTGLGAGLLTQRPRLQGFGLAAAYFAVLSLVMFWVSASILSSTFLAVAFVVCSLGLFAALAYAMRRFDLVGSTPLVFVVVYYVVCRLIAASWATSGGRLTAFLLAPNTVLCVVLGGMTFGLAVFGLTRLQRSRFAGYLPVVHATVLSILVASILVMSRDSGREPGGRAAAADRPDLYVLSIDALRSDALADYATRHPGGQLRYLLDHSTAFENVVSHGVATYDVLANNTYAGADRGSCLGSVPSLLRQQGYRTMMLLGRYGRRIAGADCYDRYYAGAGVALTRRYALPRLVAAARADGPSRENFVPSSDVVAELAGAVNVPATRPVFAYAHLLDLHAPYVPHALHDNATYLATLRWYMRACYVVACDPAVPENARRIAVVREAYQAALADVEARVAEVFWLAKARGRDFVIVLTSDHGELFGEHGGFAHSGGFVPEVLDIPFVVYDSRRPVPARRCELLLGSEAIRATAARLGDQSAPYPDHDVLRLDAPPLGTATLERATGALQFQLSDAVRPHAGTWRNIHPTADGTLTYRVETCAPTD